MSESYNEQNRDNDKKDYKAFSCDKHEGIIAASATSPGVHSTRVQFHSRTIHRRKEPLYRRHSNKKILLVSLNHAPACVVA